LKKSTYMSRIFVLSYTFITAALAGFFTIMHIQPALFFMNIFTTSNGREYYVAPVFLLSWLLFLLPIFVIMIIARLMRLKANDEIHPGRTGIAITRKKAFQSAMVAIPIFINDEKVGIIDNGKTRFFEVRSGSTTVKVGSGKQTSDEQQVILALGEQARFQIEYSTDGVRIKWVLSPLNT